MTNRSRDALRHRAAAASVILRRERSEPRRTTARTPRPHPSRAAWRPPQDDGLQVNTIILAARLSALVIARSVSDEAIQCGISDWIASLTLGMTSRSRDTLRHRAAAASVILRCERSEPRRTTARTPRPHPSRAASRPPQDDGLQVNTFILAMRLRIRAMPSHSL
jgi:hypothetical protein